MKSSSKYHYISTGLAMFSMFFGAGNVIFPLVIGQTAGHQVPYALLGLLLTAVGVPFLGLAGIILFRGNYNNFFERMGKIPGFFLVTLIMLLIGPFGGMPRCIALSYSTLRTSIPDLSLNMFSLGSCLIIFLFTVRKSQILNILGNILTPLLLVSLFIIVVAGLMTSSHQEISSLSRIEAFNYGLLEGYNTMDLLASFFFSAIVYNSLKHEFDPNEKDHDKNVFFYTLKAGCIGAFLLSLVYIGFCLVASYHAQSLGTQEQDQLLGALTLKILGPQAGLITSIAIALACLTTAIALAVVFAEFLQKSLLQHKVSYAQALIITLILTFAVSTLEFKGIVRLLAPILQVAYPALIVLTVANILSRLFNFKPVKLPVYITLVFALIAYFL